jgi:hypothetical protein
MATFIESSATSTGTVIIDVKVVENNTTDSEIMENNSFEELYFSDISLKKHTMGKTRIKVAMTTTILRKIVLFLVEFDEVSKEMDFVKEESSKVPESSKGGKSSYNSGLFF